MNETAILILLALLVAALVIWMLMKRSRPAGQHVDTSATAVGAAVETMRNVVEETAEAVEHALGRDVPDDEVIEATPVKTRDAAPAEPVRAREAAPAEPVKARDVAPPAPPVVATPKRAALTSIGIAAAKGEPDNLRQIKGLGPKLNTTLSDLGITRFDQIAAWSADDIAKVDAHLGTFKGRITRDNWVEQAGFLAKGDRAGFEAKFGKLDSPGNN